MATLALAAVGAGIGSTVGQAALGWTIGSLVGQLAFPPEGQDVVLEGPRLGDLSVSSSAYGTPISVLYGTLRMPGRLTWSEGIEEVRHVQESSSGGGKGGGSSTQTSITYTYYGTFALSFCEGPVDDVLRIWASGKLIYDKTGTNDDIVKDGVFFRFYPGDEAQQPDGIIEAAEGVGKTPAFRGQCYIVFDRLPLADFGNALPNITAELVQTFTKAQNTTDIDPFTVSEGGIASTWLSDSFAPDYDRGVFYSNQRSAAVGQNILRRFDTRTMVENRQQAYTKDANNNDIKVLQIMAVLPNGYIMANSGATNQRPIHLIDPNTLGIVGTFGVEGIGGGTSPESFDGLESGLVSWIASSDNTYLFVGTIFDSIGILRADEDGLLYVWDSDSDPRADVGIHARILGVCNGPAFLEVGVGYALAGPWYGPGIQSGNVGLYRVSVDDSAFYDATLGLLTGVEIETAVTWAPTDLVPGETHLQDVKGLLYDPLDDTVMFQVTAASNNQDYMLKYDPTSDTILWRTEIPAGRNELQGFNHSRVTSGVYGQVDSANAWALRTSTGEVFYQDTWGTLQNTSGASWWDDRTGALLGAGTNAPGFHKWLFFRGTASDAGLDEITSDICQRSGLTGSDIDVTDLAAVGVPGYALTRQMNGRAGVKPLQNLYFYDGVESDWLLKFLLRDGKSSVATILQRDLAPLDDSGDFFRETRVQEVELPMRYSLTYMDKDNDYQQATHSAKRVLGPQAAMSSRNEVGTQVAVALSNAVVKQAAQKALYSSWIERSTFTSRLPWTYLALDPADVVTITLDDGTSFRTRLVQTDLGADLSLDVSALSEDAAQYTSTVGADGGTGGPVWGFLSVAKTRLLLLCSPLLRDRDDVGRSNSQVYYFMGGYGQPGWNAATLWKSAEGTQYDQAGATINEMAWGAAGNALGDTDTPFMTDETNTLTVHMTTGASEFSSVTQLEMLNGANAFALIHSNGDVEIGQFRDVATNADVSVTLSGLLRGRRGTEVFTGGHQAGDTFLLLSTADGNLLPLDLAEVDQERYYRAVTAGSRFEDSDIDVKTSPGNDLKPYAVSHQAVTLGGGNDLDFTWVRRTRVGGALRDGVGDVPVSEDSEAYEMDILDAPGGNVVRVVTGLTTPAYTYTSANQVTDGFSPPLTSISVIIYQISAQVGRGFSEEVTLNVG